MSHSAKQITYFERLQVGSQNLQVTPAGAEITLGATESGETILLNSTSGSAVALPVATSGMKFDFIVSALGDHVITAPEDTIYGSISASISATDGSALLTSDGTTTISTTEGSALGDSFTLVSDGTNYFVSGTAKDFNGVVFA